MKHLQTDKDGRQKAGQQPEGQRYPIVLTRDLVKYYGSGENLVRAIDHTSLDLQRGEFTAIVGRSGSGKSTLLHMLGGLDRPDSGKVLIEGQDISCLKDEELARFRRRKIGFIFQDYNLVPSLNVWENIVLPIGLDGKKADKEFASSIVERIGIQDKLRALPNTLSGGQQQRVAIARALAARPAIILADEPTGNLDSKTELEVIALLKSCVNDYCQTLVVITHDETIAQMADRILVIEDGKVVSE
ncbi:ABC transporter, ATP-binding protein [Clostridium sp. KLE 1755]|uniref:ABC transporter ATP-binding protein n=1 Tax=Clostridium sp. KLE 1755 TaxID=1226325 RepID=UPI000395E6F6|nr:ABC transporter ATP-binding protein [Clostridium sp. KLE 1755]ERI66457.1 ABC transporter, ATP-binding protein [Clostridium sp. KLE 1755]